jgi:hypothetical protein
VELAPPVSPMRSSWPCLGMRCDAQLLRLIVVTQSAYGGVSNAPIERPGSLDLPSKDRAFRAGGTHDSVGPPSKFPLKEIRCMQPW